MCSLLGPDRLQYAVSYLLAGINTCIQGFDKILFMHAYYLQIFSLEAFPVCA